MTAPMKVHEPAPVTLEEFLASLASSRYDGSVILHFRGGVPQRIEIGRPLMFPLIPTKGLDKHSL
jgi:hypothetical protein